LIIKLFCPLWEEDYRVEKIALAYVQDLPVPQIVGEGEVEGWPYLVISHVPGVPAGAVWETLPLAEKREVVAQLGRLMRRLHEHPLPAELPDDWEAFIQERIAEAEGHHDMPNPWRRWIQQRVQAFREPSKERVLLNADLTEDHVLLTRHDGEWRIGGLIDFGDARIGHPFYDFVAPLAFYTFGLPELSLALLDGYGLAATPPVRDALTTYCLLHEFGRLRHFLARFPAADPAAFYQALWGEPAGVP
jgi:hygromycin-B 7''-O-kinase